MLITKEVGGIGKQKSLIKFFECITRIKTGKHMEMRFKKIGSEGIILKKMPQKPVKCYCGARNRVGCVGEIVFDLGYCAKCGIPIVDSINRESMKKEGWRYNPKNKEFIGTFDIGTAKLLDARIKFYPGEGYRLFLRAVEEAQTNRLVEIVGSKYRYCLSVVMKQGATVEYFFHAYVGGDLEKAPLQPNSLVDNFNSLVKSAKK